MRVLHVIPSLSPTDGGPSIVLPIMERALTAEGITAETITTDDDGPGRRNGFGDGSTRHENGVVRRYFRKQSEFYKISLPLSAWLRAHVSTYDVVHVHALFSYTSVVACRAARAAGVPYVIRPLGVLTRYGVTQRRAFLKRLSVRWVEGPLLRAAAAVHFTLPMEQTEAEELGIPLRAVVVPLGLETQPLPTASGATPPTVLFLSRIDPKKNIEALLLAWARCRAAFPAWRLLVAGSGDPDYVQKLRDYGASLGLGASVDWAGHVTGDAKARLMAEATVFVLPSFSENFGIAAAEALLAGKPCLFTPGVAVGAMAAVQGAALLAKVDAESLGTALHGLMGNLERRQQLGRKAKEFAQAELSSVIMGQRLAGLYREILSRRTE
jgi:glycosyltransferase involved in cell wall biosynthesis